MEKELTLETLARIGGYTDKFAGREQEYMLARLTPDILQAGREESGNMRIAGFLFIICRSGSMSLSVNLEPWEMGPDTVMVLNYDTIVRITALIDNPEAYVLMLTPEFVKALNFDMNVMSRISAARHESPIVALEPKETELIIKYIELLRISTVENPTEIYARSIARGLVVSMIYQLMQYVELHHPEEADAAPVTRRGNYVRDFFKLIHTHYRQERSVTFYASKLFISPKYLSVIVKEQTGKSAGEWIDKLVILDAKNRLRYSGKNVQQIAYDLNFVNQSSFGKYFKHLTGMTPTQYQKS